MFSRDKTPDHIKAANNLAEQINFDYTLAEQNEMLSIVLTKTLQHRQSLVENNTIALNELKEIFKSWS